MTDPLFLGWFWNGTACAGESGCGCVGADCGSGFASLEDCETAHAGCGRVVCELTGGAPDPACEPAPVELSVEICRCGSRWYWSGTECIATAACRCNAGCDLLYETEAACRAAYPSCAPDAGP